MQIAITFGAMAPKIREQIKSAGLTADMVGITHCQSDADALTRLAIRGILPQIMGRVTVTIALTTLTGIILRLLSIGRNRTMVINTKIFQCYVTRTGGWFRLFSRGFGWKNLNHSPLVFSERNGFKKHFEIGRWSFAWLT